MESSDHSANKGEASAPGVYPSTSALPPPISTAGSQQTEAPGSGRGKRWLGALLIVVGLILAVACTATAFWGGAVGSYYGGDRHFNVLSLYLIPEPLFIALLYGPWVVVGIGLYLVLKKDRRKGSPERRS